MGVLMDGIVFGESPRWRDGLLWFSDWGAGRVFSVAADGTPEVQAEVASFPMCIDFLPDGRLLGLQQRVHARVERAPEGYVQRRHEDRAQCRQRTDRLAQ